MEISTGKLLWLPQDGGIWYETTYSPSIDPSIYHHIKMIESTTKSQYIDKYKRLLSILYPDAPQINELKVSPLYQYNVRIS